MSSRRQDGATPTPRSAVSPPWALAYVTIGQRLASARHSTRVLTLHPLSALLWQHPCVTTTTNQPTNPTLSYRILSYPILPLASPRNETSRSIQLVSLLLHFARAYGARAHTLLTLAHTLRTRSTRARRNKERTRNERAGGTRGSGWGGRGGTQRKVTRFTGNARKPREREEGRGGGEGEGRAAEMDREDGGRGGGKGTREASVLQLIFTPVWFIRARHRQPRFSCPRAPTMEESPANQSAYTVHPLHSSLSPLLSSSFLFSPPPPTSRSPRPKIYGLPRRFFLDRRDPFSGSRSAPASPRIPDHFRENDSVTRWIFSNRVPYLFISRVNVSTVILFSFS